MIVGERKGMRLSDMRHRITLRQPVKTVDDSRQQITVWEDLLTGQPAKYEQVSGGEIICGKQVEAGVTALFTVNYRSEYSVDKQIVFRNQSYGIVRVDPPDGINRFADVYCKAAPVG